MRQFICYPIGFNLIHLHRLFQFIFVSFQFLNLTLYLFSSFQFLTLVIQFHFVNLNCHFISFLIPMCKFQFLFDHYDIAIPYCSGLNLFLLLTILDLDFLIEVCQYDLIIME